LLGFEGYTAEGGELSPLIQYNEERDDFLCFAFISKGGTKEKKEEKILGIIEFVHQLCKMFGLAFKLMLMREINPWVCLDFRDQQKG